jgi:peptidyl-prolyl cis-trans isomerase D
MFQGGNSTTVGSVNGTEIDVVDFQKKVDQQESYMRSQGYGGGAMLTQQAIDAAWNQEINSVLQNSELRKLGIDIGKKELGDILYGANPPEDLKKSFTDETGNFNAPAAKQQIDAILKRTKGTAEELAQREQLIAFINYLETNRKTEKYNSLLVNSSNTPKWLIERQNADNSQMANISLVREPYTSIADSTVKITDSEIKDYITKHKDDYKQEESRSIAFVTFSALPTASDSVMANDKLLQLKAEFDTVTNISRFLAMQGVRNYYDGYISGQSIQIPVKDSRSVRTVY